MPIYEYCCDKCGKVFEEWTRHIDDNVTEVCPECKGTARRIVSNTSFVLKGGGWYVTDYGYRKGKDENAGPAESGGTGQEREPGSSGDSSGAAAKTEQPATAARADSSASTTGAAAKTTAGAASPGAPAAKTSSSVKTSSTSAA
jgi:putative FmdB family regulatory protein